MRESELRHSAAITRYDRPPRPITDLPMLNEAIISNMNDGLIISDIECNILDMNPAALRLYGLSQLAEAQLHQRDFSDMFDVHDMAGAFLPTAERPLARLLREGELSKYIVRVRRRDTGIEWVGSFNGAQIRDAEGNVMGAVLTVRDITKEIAQREARDALLRELAAERALLNALIECAPVGIVLTDAEAQILRTNRAADELYARQVPFGADYDSHVELLLLREDGSTFQPRDLPLTRAALDGVKTQSIEMAIRWPDGQKRDLLVNTGPVCDAAGTLIGAVGVFQDISERKQEQDALRRYAERLATLRSIDRLILAASSAEDLATGVVSQLRRLLACEHISIVETNPDVEGRIVLASSTGTHDTWRRPNIADKVVRGPIIEKLLRGEEIIVEDLAEVASPSTFARWLLDQGVRALIVLPLQANGQLVGALLAGTDRPGDPSISASGNETLEILREVGNHIAIGLHQIRLHEQIADHAAELELTVAQRTAALQASEASLRATFEQAPTGIFSATLQGHIMRHNAALSRMLGYEYGALDGLHLRELDHPEDREDAQARFARLGSGETPDYQVEQRYLRRDGSKMQGRLTVSLVRDGGGDPAFAFGLVENITDHKRAQAALIQTEKLSVTGQLVAAVTHEINNPLQTAIGCLGLLQESMSDQSLVQASPYLHMTLQELRRIGVIVSELRDLQRKTSPEDMEPTDLVHLINRVVDLSVHKAAERRVEIAWSPPGEGPLILPLVPSRIHRVFLDLILNAIEAMPDGGRIHIEIAHTSKPSGVNVSFADTGIGIDAALMPHLFEPFYTTKSTGMGMGLYICRSIVHEHRGQIDVESTPGRGTTFNIWLPQGGSL
jgi:two-component system, sporulation sensor kinase A